MPPTLSPTPGGPTFEPSRVVTTMAAVRPWGQLSSSALDFASADSAMGHAADFALGLALAQPHRKVICLNGDGSMLMSLGTLVTIVASGATNLVLFVLQNERYELTGNQLVPGAGQVDFAGLARAAGFPQPLYFASQRRSRLNCKATAQLRHRGRVGTTSVSFFGPGSANGGRR